MADALQALAVLGWLPALWALAVWWRRRQVRRRTERESIAMHSMERGDK